MAWLALPFAIWAASLFLGNDNGKDLRSDGSPWFLTCSDAKAAGYGPMSEGEPCYAPHLDRDDDSIACEWN